ncbi:glycosyltransferase family 9 protein [Trinickia dinghuensis]|uniref:Lipopolysaccharide heptosyltransferase family protein n=1 Tax=Trinickia dinghuensis TaxID=2291023 RepID=A0A3D8JTT7_9BURK|nr:glycosyltransferase family 9 protein [Trinickia dinghuensis]RDU96468.1 lipopolysaccharide heptosyltransferase family protein [Trinickia dinghuensis]
MKRILVIRIDFLGDMVCTTPLLRALKTKWPAAEIHVLANKANRAVLEGNPDVSTVHSYVYSKQFDRNVRPGALTAIVDRLALIWRLRRLRFDMLIVPNGGMHKNSMQFARQLKVRDCRWHDEDSEFDDRKPEHVASRPIRHEALSGFRLMPELPDIDAGALKPHVYPDAGLRTKWHAALGASTKPRVGLFVSNKAEQRRWPEDNWIRLAHALGGRADLVIFRDPADRLISDRVAVSSARVIEPPTVPDLIAAMSLLDVVVSADSAPVHLAAALNLRAVAFFEDRPEKYLRWYPLGIRHVLLRGGARVDAVSPDAAAAAVNQLLDEAPGA